MVNERKTVLQTFPCGSVDVTCVFPALRANRHKSMRWSVRTELRYWLLSGSPTLDNRVCWATERTARMGSTKAKSLSTRS